MSNDNFEAWRKQLSEAMATALDATPVFDRGNMGERIRASHVRDPDMRSTMRKRYRRASMFAAMAAKH